LPRRAGGRRSRFLGWLGNYIFRAKSGPLGLDLPHRSVVAARSLDFASSGLAGAPDDVDQQQGDSNEGKRYGGSY
jgi:hypothetical protein